MEFKWSVFAEALGLNLPPAAEIKKEIQKLLLQMEDRPKAESIWQNVLAANDNRVKLESYRKRISEILNEGEKIDTAG
jgi:hypothetical protein